MVTSIPKSTTDLMFRSWRCLLTSGITIEKRVLGGEPRKSGPRDGRSNSGTVGPNALNSDYQRGSSVKDKVGYIPLGFCSVANTGISRT